MEDIGLREEDCRLDWELGADSSVRLSGWRESGAGRGLRLRRLPGSCGPTEQKLRVLARRGAGEPPGTAPACSGRHTRALPGR